MVWSQVVRIPRIPYPFSSFWVRPAIRRSDPTPWLSQPLVPLPRTVRWVVEGIRPYRSVLHPTIASSDWQAVRPSPPSWRLSANGPPQRIDPVSTVPFPCPSFGRDPTGTPGGTPGREWHEWPEWKDRIEVPMVRLGHPLSVDWRADGSFVCPSVHGSHGGVAPISSAHPSFHCFAHGRRWSNCYLLLQDGGGIACFVFSSLFFVLRCCVPSFFF